MVPKASSTRLGFTAAGPTTLALLLLLLLLLLPAVWLALFVFSEYFSRSFFFGLSFMVLFTRALLTALGLALKRESIGPSTLCVILKSKTVKLLLHTTMQLWENLCDLKQYLHLLMMRASLTTFIW